jgi:signal transduction histidine kinase
MKESLASSSRGMAADRQLAVQLACANALAESASMEEALPRVLESLCTGQGFAWGLAWLNTSGASTGTPRMVAEWPPGSSGLSSVVHDERRFEEACARGVHRFPVRDGEQLYGVIELCNPQLGRPGDGLRALMTSIGAQLVRFIQHHDSTARLYHAERQARSVAEAEAKRQAFLALAGALLTSSIDYESTLELLPRLAASTLADWCLLDVADREGRAVRVAVAHADPADADHELARGVRAAPADVAPASGDLAVQPLLLAHADDAALASALGDEHEVMLLRSVGTHSLMRVPLAARGRTFGVLSLLRTRTAEGFAPSDLGLAEELALTAAVVIDKAALQRETEEALRVRDKFLSIVSHDLTSPLHVIQLNVKLCADVLAMLPAPAASSAASSELTGGIERIGRAADRIHALVHELYEVAHGPAQDPLVLHRAPIDLVGLVRHVVEEYQQEWRDRGLELNARVTELVGLFDQHRIERVVSNLVSNAVKYSHVGGRVRVDVSCEWQGTQDATTRWAVIEVADEGIGIPQAFLPQLFMEGRRAGNVVDGQIGGRGMGLASAHQIVTRHAGSITVQSGEGRGSTFTVRLPLEPSLK